MIKFSELARLLSPKGSWDDFIQSVQERRAKSDLEELVNKDSFIEREMQEELEWQPYPVLEPEETTGEKNET